MGVREQPQLNVRIDSDLKARMLRHQHQTGRTLAWLVNEGVRRILDVLENDER